MKSRSFFSKLFSPQVAGLDIADQTVRFVVLDPTEHGFELSHHGAVQLPKGVIESGSITDPKRLADVLTQIRKIHGIRHVHVSLPKSHTFILENAGMVPHETSLRAEALMRAVAPELNAGARMLVTFGDTQIDLAVIHNGKVYQARSVSIPGNITDIIREALDATLPETIQLKRTIGLSRKDEHEHIFTVIQPVIAELAKIIDSHFVEWHTHPTEKRPKIQGIILSGSNAHIAGLSEYLTSELKIPVTMAHPWAVLNTNPSYVPPMHRDDALAYATALGLAMGIKE